MYEIWILQLIINTLYQVVALFILSQMRQIMKEAMTTRRVPINIGIMMARMDNTVEITSSAMLTGTLAVPPVVAVMAGRTTPDLATCTVPATSRPDANAKTGLISVTTFALAAKAIAPAAGRMKVCIASLM